MNMNRLLAVSVIALSGLSFLSGCTRVEPNSVGVLQENYGKNGKSDFTITQGSVNTMMPGTELYQVPLFEQRGEVSSVLHLKSSDNTDFTSKPSYSYRVIRDRAVDIVFNNRQLQGGEKEFLDSVEDNLLETRIYNIAKDAAREHSTDELMQNGGQTKFEEEVQKKVAEEFRKQGFELMTFTSQLEFTQKVKDRIETRNEVSQNVAVLDQQILEQKKKNELAELRAQENIIRSKGLTPEILQEKYIETWGGKTPIYGQMPTLTKSVDSQK